MKNEVVQDTLTFHGRADSPCVVIAKTKFGVIKQDWDGVSDFVLHVEPGNDIYKMMVINPNFDSVRLGGILVSV